MIAQLQTIGLNTAMTVGERTAAIMTANHLQSEHRFLDFSPLLAEHIDSDFERSELVGAALIASWPQSVSTAAAFTALATTSPSKVIGLHWSFVRELAKALGPHELGSAMRWVLSFGGQSDDDWRRPLVDAITYLALTNPQHAEAHAYAVSRVRALLLSYRPIFDARAEYELEPETRRRLATELLSAPGSDVAHALITAGGGRGSALISGADLDWLIRAYPAARGDLRTNLGEVIQCIYNPADADHNAGLFALPQEHGVVTEVLHFWLTPVEIDSDYARQQRDRWSRIASRAQAADDANARESAELNERIAGLAKDAARGDLLAFWQACRFITVRRQSMCYEEEWNPDLTTHPRWSELAESTHGELVHAARTYLDEGNCAPEDWLGQGLRHHPAEAGFRALVLLRRFDQGTFASLPASVWRRWAPIIATWQAYEPDAVATRHELINTALPFAALELRSAALETARAGWAGDELALTDQDFDPLWNPWLENEICSDLRLSGAGVARDQMLDVLMTHAASRARDFLADQLSVGVRQRESEQARAAAVRLFRSDATSAWPLLGPLLIDDPEFMQDVLLAANVGRGAPDIAEEGLADLYLWLMQHFPPAQDPAVEGAHFVGPRERIRDWRDSILGALSTRGTDQAVTAIRRIMAAHPDLDWMVQVLLTAENARRRGDWRPLTAHALGALAASAKARVIRDARDVSDVVLETLDDIQHVLQGDTPDAALLWDTHSRRPKDEDDISDYLRNRLRERLSESGIVVNREVQIKRITGIGQRTDLRVDAISPGLDQPVVTMVGEVKGCWYSDLITPVTDQLVNRYMSRVGTTTGVRAIRGS